MTLQVRQAYNRPPGYINLGCIYTSQCEYSKVELSEDTGYNIELIKKINAVYFIRITSKTTFECAEFVPGGLNLRYTLYANPDNFREILAICENYWMENIYKKSS